MIPLMKNAFIKEYETKAKLSEFILKSNRLSMGEKCLEFEKKFAEYQGRQIAVLFNSGGSSNLALLQSLKNIGKLNVNSKIGFSSVTWSTNVMPIIQMGMQPIPIDVEPATINVMSSNLLERISETTLDALFITNALGNTGDLDRIKEICEENNILLIEDNCESLGSELPDGKLGNFGFASTFSFFVAHHMSTIEGGMVCTNDEELGKMLKIVRANGWDRNLHAEQQVQLRKQHKILSEFQAKYSFYDLGFNFRPTEITGFLGITQLEYLDENIKIRNKNYKRLEKIINQNPELIPLKYDYLKFFSPFATPIICKSVELKEKYVAQFSGAGIEIRSMIAGNIQNQPFFKKYVMKSYDLPGADFLDRCSFYCGNYPELNEADLDTISSCLIIY